MRVRVTKMVEKLGRLLGFVGQEQGLRFVLVEKGCIRSVMLTAVRSQCLLAKTFMMIYAASSFIISIKTHCCVCKVVGCCRTTNHVKGVVGGKKRW